MTTTQSRVAVYLPGLFSPIQHNISRDDLLSLTSINQVLRFSQAKKITQAVNESYFLDMMGLEAIGSQFPAGLLSAQAVGSANPHKYYMRADPVHFKVDRDQAYLLPADVLCIREEEATAVVETLNQNLSSQGLQLTVLDPCQWLLIAEQPIPITCVGLADASWKNVEPLLPGGKGSRFWRRLLTELQMLLHQHPVNRQRGNKNLTINSLWFWGPGDVRIKNGGSAYRGLYADELCFRGMAKLAGVKLQPVREFFQISELKNNPLLCVDYTLYRANIKNDPELLLQNLLELDKYLIAKLLDLLRQRQLQNLTMYTDGYCLDLTPAGLRRVWRRAKSLLDFNPND